MSKNISCRALLAAAAAWPAETQKNRQRKRERESVIVVKGVLYVVAVVEPDRSFHNLRLKKRQSTYSMKSRDVGRGFLYSETVIGSVEKK